VSYVFLSHARRDVDPYFETFYKDFLAELRGRIGDNTTETLAFRDSEGIPLGAQWEPMIERELLTCRIFIAMLSPTYLRRPACSKEWASFEWRLKTSEGAAPPDLLLPLVWIPIPNDDLPPAVRARQSAHASLGDAYARRGLRHVVQRAGVEYQDLLTVLAERVRDLVRKPAPLPPTTLLAPDKLPDPFASSKAVTAPTPTTTFTALGGPKHVEFIVVAARQAELESERQIVTAYGTDVHDWCPYSPALDTRVGLLVQQVALEQKLTAGFPEVAQNIVDRLQGARAKNTLAVLIIDVWSLRLHSYRTFMNLFDRAERFANAGVLVLWNLADGETLTRREALLDTLRLAFPNLMVMKDPLAFHEQIATPDELFEKLHHTLQVLRRRIVDFGEVMRKAEGVAEITKPLLVVSGAA
jgi:FxsC-like protein